MSFLKTALVAAFLATTALAPVHAQTAPDPASPTVQDPNAGQGGNIFQRFARGVGNVLSGGQQGATGNGNTTGVASAGNGNGSGGGGNDSGDNDDDDDDDGDDGDDNGSDDSDDDDDDDN